MRIVVEELFVCFGCLDFLVLAIQEFLERRRAFGVLERDETKGG